MCDAHLRASLQFPFPIDLVGDRGLQPLIGELLVLSLGSGQHLCKEPLRPVLALGGIDREGAHDGLRHRHGHIAIAVAHGDVAVGLIENDVLETFLVERRWLVLRPPRTPHRITRLSGLEARVFRWLCIAHLVVGIGLVHKQPGFFSGHSAASKVVS